MTSTFDAEEQKRRIAQAKAKMLEAIDLMTTWQEAEDKKKNATPPEHQQK